jgi:bifunctional NMN adenylyltransferase/nudix hydrolase
VIVGRFQVPELHEGHIELIKHVKKMGDRLLVAIGNAVTGPTGRNPLDYPTREHMIRQAFPDPDITTLCVTDHPSDKEWSHILDSTIRAIYPLAKQVTLFGGRDSFIPHYHGQYPTVEIQLTSSLSGTQIRQMAASKIIVSTDFRAGMIYALQNQFPRINPTVDIAVVDGSRRLLMGMKPNESQWRLPGGFVDRSKDRRWEDAAIRELREETNIVLLDDPVYLGSLTVDDWRYKNAEEGCIFTSLFVAHYPFFTGEVRAGDDLKQVSWIPFEKLTPEFVVPTHLPLIKLLLEKIGGNNENSETTSR